MATARTSSTNLEVQQPQTGLRSNALNSKITSILSSSYADLEIRDALETLDQQGTRNTAETRRNLRLDIIKESIACDAEIVHDFGHVASQLRVVGELLSQLRSTTASLRSQITAARLETAPMNTETKHLLSQQETLKNKRSILSAFTDHFLLTTEEVSLLTSTSIENASGRPVLDDSFFAALVKAKRIQVDSRVLLSSASQRLGTDILARSSQILAQSYSKLHRCILRDFRAMDLENPSLNANLRRALRVLAERPALFRNALDLFAEGREQILEDGFYVALTGDQGRRPIEASAGEPLRYVGDMLAWAHGAAVGEREALEGLFIAEGEEIARGIKAGLESEPWLRPNFGEDEAESNAAPEEGFNGEKTLQELIDRNLRGVGRVLKGRVEMLVKGSEDPTLPYRISNLFRFYASVFSRVMGGHGEFMGLLNQLEQSSIQQFKASTRYQVTNLRNDKIIVDESLGTPEFFATTLEELKGLLQSYDTSVRPTDNDKSDLEMLLAEAFDSRLDICRELSKAVLQAPQTQIFFVNCLLAARDMLSNFPFTRGKSQSIYEIIEEQVSELSALALRSMLVKSGLQPLVAAIDKLPEDADVLNSPLAMGAFQPQSLIDASQQLDEFLPSALVDAMENVKGLQSSTVAHQVADEAAEEFCAIFGRLRERVERAAETQVDLKDDELGILDLFPRTVEEIKILLS